MLKYILLFAGSLLFTGISATPFDLKANDSVPNLELSFKLTDEGRRISEYYLLVYCDSNAADTLFVKKGKTAYLYLHYNHHYTLRYVKHGYRDRILIVQTFMTPSTRIKNMEFDYQVELVKTGETANTLADLPVAIIRYDKHKKRFDYSRKYHRQVRQKPAKH